MRLMLANMVFAFDMELAEESKTWMETQTAHPLWKKGPLYVTLKPVR